MKKHLILSFFLLLFIESIKAQPKINDLTCADYESQVSKADLNYTTPVVRSEEGIPIGNGRMGTLVWTTPNALHFQINRVDVFAMGNNTNSFPWGHDNYSNGCGFMDIHLADYGDDVFTGTAFNQHLSVFDGLTTANGNGITSRIVAYVNQDVIATELNDQRNNPSIINIDLRMLRYAMRYDENKNYNLTSKHAVEFKTGFHTATSRLDIRNGRIILTQEFREGNFYSASAVAVEVSGRKSKASYYNESTVRLSVEPGKGKFNILTASASSYNPDEDVADLALRQLDAVQSKSFDELLENNRIWWGNYWAKGLIQLHSADGVADEVEKNYTYFLYIMASCSRGEYMPRFSGMLWYSNGDLCMWGSQYWWHNQGAYYDGLTPANRPEIMDPVFSTYSKNLESFVKAANQQWGSKGIWIPETSWFDGLEVLPDSIAAEMQDLYLAKKSWDKASTAFLNYARNKNGLNSRWNWQFLANKKGPFAWTSHIMSTTAKISYLYWLRYAYYLDKEWLKTTAYPMIKGTVEFYRNFPNFYKSQDGKYHIRYINNLESNWGGADSPEELLAMHVMLPIAIRASEILDVDAELRPVWKEILDNLTPIPSSIDPASYYDLCNIGTENKELFESVLDAYNKRYLNGVNDKTKVDVLSRDAVAAANLGLADRVKYLIPSQIRSFKEDNCDYIGTGESGVGVIRNRLMLREGPGAIECERLGLAAQALILALLQSVPPSPGKEPVNYIFPAWPKEWDAQYTLAAQDAFLITASMKNGQIEFVEINSQKGGVCRVQNPWPGTELIIYRNGKKAENISGKLLVINTEQREIIILMPKGI
ncbi:MAG: DUF5703 domain-containing protein [Bacteroidota bacterium]